MYLTNTPSLRKLRFGTNIYSPSRCARLAIKQHAIDYVYLIFKIKGKAKKNPLHIFNYILYKAVHQQPNL